MCVEDPLEKEMATHSSILAWRIPWTEETGKLHSIGLQKFRHSWSNFHSTVHILCFHPSYLSYCDSFFISFIMIFSDRFSSFSSVQFSSVAQSWPTLCDPINRRTQGLHVHHQLPEITQIYVHRVSDAIQPSHPLLSPSPPDPNRSQHQVLFQWLNSSHQVAKVMEFQL